MKIEKAALSSAYQLLHDGALALARMEANGIKVDVPYLEGAMQETARQIRAGEAELRADQFVYGAWRKRYGEAANLTSRAQLAEVIFKVLKYPSLAKTATGRDKADATAFDHLDLPFVKKYLALEKLRKVRNTFLQGILSEQVGGYLHPFFNLHTVSTYRSSSDSPNFQNFPTRDPVMGAWVRRAFVPRWNLVEVDFSGIEVRVAATYHKDPAMLTYIKDPTTDMHRDQAAKLYCLKVDFLKENKDWTKKAVRDWSKNRFVFPQFYGSVYFQCAPDLWEPIQAGATLPCGKSLRKHLKENGIRELGDCDPKGRPASNSFVWHVKKVEEEMWNQRFPVYSRWKKDWYQSYLKAGEFYMHTGFRCAGVFKRNEVINYPVQGAAFHCLLWSIIRIQRWLDKYDMRTRLVGQIHDSLIADVPDDELQDFLTAAHNIMTVRLPKAWDWINVPLETEAEVATAGQTWHDKKQWVCNSGHWGPR